MTAFHVFTNLASSIDGKITTKDRAHIDPSRYDRHLMDVHRRRADAVLMGAGTLRAFRRPVKVSSSLFRLVRKLGKRKPQPLNVVLARHLDFDPSWAFFTDSQIERLLVVPDSATDQQLAPFLASCEIFRFRDAPGFPQQIIEALQAKGCSSLLLEGGGGIMFPWVEQDLIDEWNVTITPRVIGGKDAPTMVEGEGFAVNEIKRYRLKRHWSRGNEVFLQYVRLFEKRG